MTSQLSCGLPCPRAVGLASLRASGHIVEVAGGGSGGAYAGWLSDSNPSGCAQFLRAFSITRGWLSAAFQVSSQHASALVRPRDPFGISTLSPTNVLPSWGGAVNGKQSEVFAAPVTGSLP